MGGLRLSCASHKYRTFFVLLRKDKVITLQPFVWLSFFQHGGGVSLAGKHFPISVCFVTPEDGGITLTSSLCSHVNIFIYECMVMVMYENTPPPRPLLLSSQYFSPSAETNGSKRGLLRSWCQIHFQCGWGSEQDYVAICRKTIKPRPRDRRLKWCCTEPHHHNLERPSLAASKESRGPLSKSCADSTTRWSSLGKRGISKAVQFQILIITLLLYIIHFRGEKPTVSVF